MTNKYILLLMLMTAEIFLIIFRVCTVCPVTSLENYLKITKRRHTFWAEFIRCRNFCYFLLIFKNIFTGLQINWKNYVPNTLQSKSHNPSLMWSIWDNSNSSLLPCSEILSHKKAFITYRSGSSSTNRTKTWETFSSVVQCLN